MVALRKKGLHVLYGYRFSDLTEEVGVLLVEAEIEFTYFDIGEGVHPSNKEGFKISPTLIRDDRYICRGIHEIRTYVEMMKEVNNGNRKV